jgi:hypothetical protein
MELRQVSLLREQGDPVPTSVVAESANAAQARERVVSS